MLREYRNGDGERRFGGYVASRTPWIRIALRFGYLLCAKVHYFLALENKKNLEISAFDLTVDKPYLFFDLETVIDSDLLSDILIN